MTKMRIIYDNLIDAVTLSASPSMVATLPESNLQNPNRSRVARTTSLATQQILGTGAAASIVSGMVLWRHNLSASSTMRLQLYDGPSQTGSLVYDSGAVTAYDFKALGDLLWGMDALEASVFDTWNIYWSTLWFDPVAARSFRLTLTDPTNADGYMEVSRVVLGPYLSPTFNPNYGMTLGWSEEVKQQRTAGGTLHSDPAVAYRQLQIILEMLQDTDRPNFLEMTRQVGKRKDFFISIYPDFGGTLERDYSMLAKMVQDSPMSHPFYASHSQTFKMQET